MWIQRLFWPTIFWNFRELGSPHGMLIPGQPVTDLDCLLPFTLAITYTLMLRLGNAKHKVSCAETLEACWSQLCLATPSKALLYSVCDAWWCLSLIHELFGTQEILKRNAALATCRTLLLLQGTSHWMEVLKLRRATTTYQGRSWG